MGAYESLITTITLTASPRIITLGSTTTIFAIVTDQHGNLVPGARTIFWTTTGPAQLLPATSTIDGIISITATPTREGPYELKATITETLFATTILVGEEIIGATGGIIAYPISHGTLTARFGTYTEDYYLVIELDLRSTRWNTRRNNRKRWPEIYYRNHYPFLMDGCNRS